jgi:hypothetical protein
MLQQNIISLLVYNSTIKNMAMMPVCDIIADKYEVLPKNKINLTTSTTTSNNNNNNSVPSIQFLY